MESAASPRLPAVLDDMRRERDRFVALVSRLTSEELDVGRPGGWTLRRVLHHVIESDATYTKLLAYLCGRTAPELDVTPPSDGDAAVGQLAATRVAMLAMVDGVDDDTIHRLVRVAHEEYSPLSVLENVASHDRDHHGQVLDLLAGRMPREVAPVPGVTVRDARPDDLPALTEIYNHYVRTSPVTFDIEPFTVGRRREWFAQFGASGRHRLVVADEDGRAIAYACSHPFRPKQAFDTTVETTVYCAPDALGRGVGRLLYAALFDALRGQDLRLAVAAITLPHEASIRLHEDFGFTCVGVTHAVGRKFDRYWDVAWYEKPLDPSA
jgi:phosphinothricin acetyltransferase